MNPSPAATATARRNVAQRIERFLKGLAHAKRQPNRRETYHVRNALERLEVGQYPEGKEAMLNAERCTPLPPQVAAQIASNEIATLSQLQEQFERILQSAG